MQLANKACNHRLYLRLELVFTYPLVVHMKYLKYKCLCEADVILAVLYYTVLVHCSYVLIQWVHV